MIYTPRAHREWKATHPATYKMERIHKKKVLKELVIKLREREKDKPNA